MAVLTAVVGIGQTKYEAKRLDVSMPGLIREAAERALVDAGCTWRDIDAVIIGKAPDLFEGVMMPELFLNDAIGGRSIRPPQPKGVAELGYGNPKWNETTGAERYRRGLYVHYQRTTPYPLMAAFDAPDASIACSRRRKSNTALQALNLLNDPVFFEASQSLAARVLRESPAATRIDYAYALCLSRPPTAREREKVAQLYTQHLQQLDDATAADWMPAPPDGVTQREAAAWTGIARVLLNLDEFITRE